MIAFGSSKESFQNLQFDKESEDFKTVIFLLKACDFLPIEENDKGLIWKYRYPLLQEYPESIVKILFSVDWGN